MGLAPSYVCLVCRYEISVLQQQPKKDWSVAARHYRLAMAVFPSGERLHLHLSNPNYPPTTCTQLLPSAATAKHQHMTVCQLWGLACAVDFAPNAEDAGS